MTDLLATRHRTLQLVDPMPKNPYRPGTSEWWLYRLNAQIDGRDNALGVLDDYYRGRQDTFRLASSAAIDSGIAALFRGINANLSKLIVDAAAQRLEVYGFRTGDDGLDDELWRVWQANDMDAWSGMAHKDALAMRACPVLVEPPAEDGGLPRITPQNPRNVAVETAPGDWRIVRAALKRWRDDSGRRLHTLYLPDRIEFWQDAQPGSGFLSAVRDVLGVPVPEYEPRSLERATRLRNPLGEVPFAIIPNMARSDGTYEAEHESVLPLLDLYNKTLLDMATTSEFSAFPQRYGIGIEIEEPEAPTTAEGEAAAAGSTALARMRSAIDAMITTPNEQAQFGQFPAAELSNYVNALDQIRANIGTITFTPFHLLLNMPTAVPATGEALKAAEIGLTRKIRGDHQREKGVGWERTQRLVIKLLGRPLPAVIETEWADPETRSEAVHTDALVKLRQGLGLPRSAVWGMMPASRAQVKRWSEDVERPGEAPTNPAQRADNARISGGELPSNETEG